MLKKRILMIVMLLMSLKGMAEEEYSSLLLGDDKGQIYYSENIDERHPLASVTKMVNLMVVYDKIHAGEIKLTDMVPISEKARNLGGSRIWMGRGARISVEELIKATAIYSANNAAYALAEYVSGGDVDKFIELMNEKAREVGAGGDVVFYTPMGLPPHMTGTGMDEGSARGIYLLSLEALKYPDYIKIASTKETVIQGSQRIWNRNKLLSKEKGIYGIKTGHHSTAGYNISIASKRNDINAITVVFGSPTEYRRNKVAEETIDHFYEEFKVRKVVDSHAALGRIRVERGEEEYLSIYPEKDIMKLTSKNWNVKIEADYNKRIVAPVSKGEKLGSYRVLVNGETVGRGSIYSGEDIAREDVMEEVLRDIFEDRKAEI